jgi:uncharacterized membrane protein
MMSARPVPRERMQSAFLALTAATLICALMLLARRLFSGETKFMFLIWNLFLAWIPLLFAFPIYVMRARGVNRPKLLLLCAAVWFFFYPNAPYLITDLVHLKTRLPVPRWYDLVLMMSFAWTGVFLGVFSLYLMQEVIRAWRGRAASWLFAITMLALGAFGVFVGRFWRWNSWEAFTRPFGLATDTVRRLKLEDMNWAEAASFSITFFAFSLLTYLTVYALTHLHGYVDRPIATPSDKSRLPS